LRERNTSILKILKDQRGGEIKLERESEEIKRKKSSFRKFQFIDF
jgi:hypothetical protein